MDFVATSLLNPGTPDSNDADMKYRRLLDKWSLIDAFWTAVPYYACFVGAVAAVLLMLGRPSGWTSVLGMLGMLGMLDQAVTGWPLIRLVLRKTGAHPAAAGGHVALWISWWCSFWMVLWTVLLMVLWMVLATKASFAPSPSPLPSPFLSPSTSPTGFHPGTVCDKTGQGPIVGWSFHLTGTNYDLCETEFNKLPEAEKVGYEKIAPPPLMDCWVELPPNTFYKPGDFDYRELHKIECPHPSRIQPAPISQMNFTRMPRLQEAEEIEEMEAMRISLTSSGKYATPEIWKLFAEAVERGEGWRMLLPLKGIERRAANLEKVDLEKKVETNRQEYQEMRKLFFSAIKKGDQAWRSGFAAGAAEVGAAEAGAAEAEAGVAKAARHLQATGEAAAGTDFSLAGGGILKVKASDKGLAISGALPSFSGSPEGAALSARLSEAEKENARLAAEITNLMSVHRNYKFRVAKSWAVEKERADGLQVKLDGALRGKKEAAVKAAAGAWEEAAVKLDEALRGKKEAAAEAAAKFEAAAATHAAVAAAAAASEFEAAAAAAAKFEAAAAAAADAVAKVEAVPAAQVVANTKNCKVVQLDCSRNGGKVRKVHASVCTSDVANFTNSSWFTEKDRAEKENVRLAAELENCTAVHQDCSRSGGRLRKYVSYVAKSWAVEKERADGLQAQLDEALRRKMEAAVKAAAKAEAIAAARRHVRRQQRALWAGWGKKGAAAKFEVAAAAAADTVAKAEAAAAAAVVAKAEAEWAERVRLNGTPGPIVLRPPLAPPVASLVAWERSLQVSLLKYLLVGTGKTGQVAGQAAGAKAGEETELAYTTVTVPVGATCSSKGVTPIATASECTQAIATVNANGWPESSSIGSLASSSFKEVSYSFAPPGCYVVCVDFQHVHSDYFCGGRFNTHPTGRGGTDLVEGAGPKVKVKALTSARWLGTFNQICAPAQANGQAKLDEGSRGNKAAAAEAAAEEEAVAAV